MSIKIYYNDLSPPCRAVLLTVGALGGDVALHEIQIYGKDQDQDFLNVRNSQSFFINYYIIFFLRLIPIILYQHSYKKISSCGKVMRLLATWWGTWGALNYIQVTQNYEQQ